MLKYLIPSITLLFLDLLWLNIFMGKQYNKMIPLIQHEKMVINTLSASVAYLSMIIILNYIIIRKNLSLIETFVLGSSIYAVYDFTCGAIFKKWDHKLAIIDIIWGGIVFTIAKYVSDLL